MNSFDGPHGPADNRREAPTMRLRYLLIAPLVALALLGVAPSPASAKTGLPPDTATAGAVTVAVRGAAATVVVTIRVVLGHTSWGLGVTHCGRGNAYQTGGVVVRATAASIDNAPVGTVRDPARIWPGDTATVTCARTTTPVATPTTTSRRWVSPLASYTLTSCFGWRASTNSFHRGLDMSAGKGTPIRAAAAGVVTRTGWLWGGYGISTVIYHGGGIWSHYAHQSVSLVRAGQRVAAGQMIGRVGNTGFVISSRGGDGSHLHLELANSATVLKRQFNPAPFLRNHGVKIGC